MNANCFLNIGKTNRDEYYTPRYAVTPLLKYLTPKSIIWCPFDTEKSEFVKVLQQAGHNVVYSHIALGQDFFTYEPPQYDYIISNPPFSRKREVLERLRKLGKPYAMLLPLNLLNDDYSNELDSNLELILFDKRMEFKNKDKSVSRISFKCVYFCKGIVGRGIVFEKLERRKSDEMLDYEIWSERKMSLFA